MYKYFWNVLIWIDQGFNVIFGVMLNPFIRSGNKFGNPDETLSSVFGKNVREGKCKGCHFICKLLHRLDPDHCKKSIEDDEA